MKIIKRTLIVLIVLLVAIQVVRPAKTNPAVDNTKTIEANTQMSPQVAAILQRSCYDCHSFKTTWPWYSQVAPVSWYLVYDVNKGRRDLSLSEWTKYDARRSARKLQEICEQIEKGEMPTKPYLMLHTIAKLSDSDKKALCDWANTERERVLASQPKSSS